MSRILKFNVLFRMLDSQKRGFVPAAYVHLQQPQHHQQPQSLLPATPHLPGYSPYCHPGSIHPGGFFSAGGSEERARSSTTSPVGSTPDGTGYTSATAASPPTPPVTPGNRHQLPSHHHHQQQLVTGHVTASVSPPGILTRPTHG